MLAPTIFKIKLGFFFYVPASFFSFSSLPFNMPSPFYIVQYPAENFTQPCHLLLHWGNVDKFPLYSMLHQLHQYL